uniref:Uncharacterized protein n=1 Tax=Zea mays TaxID=4577 RepID=C4J2I4_MAIZE|nr:unknown [Zea mays]
MRVQSRYLGSVNSQAAPLCCTLLERLHITRRPKPPGNVSVYGR